MLQKEPVEPSWDLGQLVQLQLLAYGMPWLFSVGAQICYPGTKLKPTRCAATFASTGPYFNGTTGEPAEYLLCNCRLHGKEQQHEGQEVNRS
jgi:hypothetical protein